MVCLFTDVISNLMYKLFGSQFTSTCATFAVTFNAFEEPINDNNQDNSEEPGPETIKHNNSCY